MDDVERIKAEMNYAARHGGEFVQVRCLNKREAEEIESRLSEEDRPYVRFTWLIK